MGAGRCGLQLARSMVLADVPVTAVAVRSPASRRRARRALPGIEMCGAIWMLVLLGVFGSAMLTFWAISRIVEPLWGVRFMLFVLIGGFGAYNYLALGFPYALDWISSESGGAFGVLLFTLAGEALGIILAWVWWRWFSESKSQAN